MPRKIRELLRELRQADFYELSGAGKGSHRKYIHEKYAGVVTISGKEGDDAKHYQEWQVRKAIASIKK
jgi:predicted RNA binding protein YcfA (HicA-like mRNA interferase family)